MTKKYVTFDISPQTWSEFEENIAIKNQELFSKTNDKKVKKLDRSSVVTYLLDGLIKGKFTIDLDAPRESGHPLKGVVIEVMLWKEVRNYLMQKEVEGKKISGGFGGLVTRLVDAYNAKLIGADNAKKVEA